MQQIVIPVEDKVALFWQNVGQEQRAQLIQWFSRLVARAGRAPLSPEGFAQLLDAVSEQAQQRGLTPEILEEILHED